MSEVMVVCEGKAEQQFCNGVLAPALGNMGIWLKGTMVGDAHRKRGGIRGWKDVYRKELLKHAKGRGGRYVAVLVDFYAMPHTWPGRDSATACPIEQRGHHVEQALVEDLQPDLGDRFVPCVQLHEFESLLFIDSETTALNIADRAGLEDHETLARDISRIRADHGGRVEAINDSVHTAPSKRLAELCPAYDKVAWGVLAAQEAGLPALRAGCPWLDRWLTSLETLGGHRDG